jgi:ribonuclease HI
VLIVAAADGSALGNPGPAGWAWYVDDDHWAAGGWPHGTNNQGELKAVIDLFQATSHLADHELQVLCDSQYVINAVTKWMPGWKRRGWRKADGSPVMNVELLKELDAAISGRRYGFEWVKGHAGHSLNEAADQRARAVATAFQNRQPVPKGPGWGAHGDAAESSVPDGSADDALPYTRGNASAAGSTGPARNNVGSAVGSPGPATVSTSSAKADGDVSADQAEVLALEHVLLGPEVRRDRKRLVSLLHPDFQEFGEAGEFRTRDELLSADDNGESSPGIGLLDISSIAAGAILLTYTMSGADGEVRRSSLWLKTGSGWQLRFRQGTVVRDEEAAAKRSYQATFDF